MSELHCNDSIIHDVAGAHSGLVCSSCHGRSDWWDGFRLQLWAVHPHHMLLWPEGCSAGSVQWSGTTPRTWRGYGHILQNHTGLSVSKCMQVPHRPVLYSLHACATVYFRFSMCGEYRTGCSNACCCQNLAVVHMHCVVQTVLLQVVVSGQMRSILTSYVVVWQCWMIAGCWVNQVLSWCQAAHWWCPMSCRGWTLPLWECCSWEAACRWWFQTLSCFPLPPCAAAVWAVLLFCFICAGVHQCQKDCWGAAACCAWLTPVLAQNVKAYIFSAWTLDPTFSKLLIKLLLAWCWWRVQSETSDVTYVQYSDRLPHNWQSKLPHRSIVRIMWWECRAQCWLERLNWKKRLSTLFWMALTWHVMDLTCWLQMWNLTWFSTDVIMFQAVSL